MPTNTASVRGGLVSDVSAGSVCLAEVEHCVPKVV